MAGSTAPPAPRTRLSWHAVEVLPAAGTAPYHPTPLFTHSQLLFKNIPAVSSPGISTSHQRERLGMPKKEEAWDRAQPGTVLPG